jgi:hypothetical protein
MTTQIHAAPWIVLLMMMYASKDEGTVKYYGPS